jgi:hypothetical protein
LLVDKNRVYQTIGWAFNSNGVFWVSSSDRYPEGYEFIASTKPLEGLPLLVIEDEVENLANQAEIEEYKDNDPYDQFYAGGDFYEGFKQGYNKSKETYKFTEEDMRKAISMARDYPADVVGYQKDEIIQSLTKKELWIEVEQWSLAENVTAKNQNVLKISNNQIKAVWK